MRATNTYAHTVEEPATTNGRASCIYREINKALKLAPAWLAKSEDWRSPKTRNHRLLRVPPSEGFFPPTLGYEWISCRGAIPHQVSGPHFGQPMVHFEDLPGFPPGRRLQALLSGHSHGPNPGRRRREDTSLPNSFDSSVRISGLTGRPVHR